MEYVLETLEIERSRVSRAIREFEMLPGQGGEEAGRELLLRNRKRVLEEAIASLTDPASAERELDPALDAAYPAEVLRAERARLLEVNRVLAATVESEGVKYPWGRIEVNLERARELEEWAPRLEERLDRRSRIGFE